MRRAEEHPFAREGITGLQLRRFALQEARMAKNFSVSRRAAFVLVFLMFAACGSARAKEKEVPSALRAQIDSAIAKVKPALVRIRVVSTEYTDGREVKMQAVGSGAIITKDGYLITNHHV